MFLGLAHITSMIKPRHDREVFRCSRITLGEKRGGRPMPIVSESGLYKIIMRSDKAKAHEFEEWATRVVLPSDWLQYEVGRIGHRLQRNSPSRA